MLQILYEHMYVHRSVGSSTAHKYNAARAPGDRLGTHHGQKQALKLYQAVGEALLRKDI
jgi:hypothetical protein